MSPLLRAKRKRIGKQITQRRKAKSKTVATNGKATTLIANLQGELVVAQARIAELEDMNEIIQGELDSYHQHEEEVAEDSDSFDGFPDSDSVAEMLADMAEAMAAEDPASAGDTA